MKKVNKLLKGGKKSKGSNATKLLIPLAGVFYYVFNFVVALVMECVEKKFQYYR